MFAFRDTQMWLVRLNKHVMRIDFNRVLFYEYYHTRVAAN